VPGRKQAIFEIQIIIDQILAFCNDLMPLYQSLVKKAKDDNKNQFQI